MLKKYATTNALVAGVARDETGDGEMGRHDKASRRLTVDGWANNKQVPPKSGRLGFHHPSTAALKVWSSAHQLAWRVDGQWQSRLCRCTNKPAPQAGTEAREWRGRREVWRGRAGRFGRRELTWSDSDGGGRGGLDGRGDDEAGA